MRMEFSYSSLGKHIMKFSVKKFKISMKNFNFQVHTLRLALKNHL